VGEEGCPGGLTICQIGERSALHHAHAEASCTDCGKDNECQYNAQRVSYPFFTFHFFSSKNICDNPVLY
jgi:hypothetical protein